MTLSDLIPIAARHGRRNGNAPAWLGLTIWTADAPTTSVPALFERKFYLLLQGAKRMTIGGTTVEVRAGRCAVASVGLPFTSEVLEASPAMPYIGVEIRLDGSTISALPSKYDRTPKAAGAITFADAPINVLEPLGRLLGLLDTPTDIPVLARQYEREVWYRLLQGPLEHRARQSAAETTRLARSGRPPSGLPATRTSLSALTGSPPTLG